MDYQKYSKAAFASLPPGSPELMRRLTELQLDVREELHSAIRAKFEEIAARLNALGHDLRETACLSQRPSEIDYCEGGKKVGCEFYVCYDAVVSAGYGGAAACDAEMKDQLEWEKGWATAAAVRGEKISDKSRENSGPVSLTTPILNLVVLRVPDIEEAQRFYSLLGFSFTKHAHGSGPQHYAAECGAQVFEIYPQLSAEDSTKSVRIGFKVPALDSTVARLVGGGAKIISAPKDSPWGRRAVISDPIGHKIELVEDGIDHA